MAVTAYNTWNHCLLTGAGKPLVVAHGKNVPTNISDLVYDMQSPLTKTQVGSTGRSVQV